MKSQSLGNHHAVTHGMSYSTTYKSWDKMLERCTNPNAHNYPHYGGRGITVCGRWRKFENFLADMGVRPEGMTIDRENRDGNYEPSNCRWASRSEQARNRSDNVLITIDGETMIQADWAKRSGVPAQTIQRRRSRGWSDRDAVMLPKYVRGYTKKLQRGADSC